uniref:Uncharacterized protein n=1 Tax=Spironucleus salmonicida TaxID=348837 RepID=V6LMC8_9EUKA|eukprot:EST44861.1 Hypothetical protein SS50377_15242 [Spironucleus salmonicida]
MFTWAFRALERTVLKYLDWCYCSVRPRYSEKRAQCQKIAHVGSEFWRSAFTAASGSASANRRSRARVRGAARIGLSSVEFEHSYALVRVSVHRNWQRVHNFDRHEGPLCAALLGKGVDFGSGCREGERAFRYSAQQMINMDGQPPGKNVESWVLALSV